MDSQRFRNACRILLNIDKHELVEAGIIADDARSGTYWARFYNDPLIFIAKLNDDKYDALFSMIEARQPKRLTAAALVAK